MNILMLSSDEKILTSGTEARERMRKYAAAFGNLTVIVLTHSADEPFEANG